MFRRMRLTANDLNVIHIALTIVRDELVRLQEPGAERYEAVADKIVSACGGILYHYGQETNVQQKKGVTGQNQDKM